MVSYRYDNMYVVTWSTICPASGMLTIMGDLVAEDRLFGDDYQSLGPDASTIGTSSGYVQCFARNGATWCNNAPPPPLEVENLMYCLEI